MWKLFALHALHASHSVAVCAQTSITESKELDEFKHLGGVVFPYEHPNWLQRRMAAKGWYSRFGRMKRWGPDLICVSLGATCDPFWQRDLLEMLQMNSAPQLFIVQANAEGFIKGDAQREALRPLYTSALRIICVSRANATLLERQLAAALPNVLILPNPIRSRLEKPLAWPDNASGAVHFATVARYDVDCKCQDQTLEAFASPEWENRNWRLSLFGSGADEIYLRDLIGYYGLQKHVSISGYERDFRKIWAGNHLHILNSRAEGLTLALIESMFCGRPAVITRAGGNHELLRDGIDGFVSPGSDPDIIRETFEIAWASREKWQLMGESAFQRATDWIPSDLGVRLLNTITGEKNGAVQESAHIQ